MKIYNPSYLRDTPSNYKPENLHLLIETGTKPNQVFYFVRADNNNILEKTTDKFLTSSTVETRTGKDIARCFHDRDNKIIYFVDSEYDNTFSYVWELDYNNTEIVTEITSIPADVFDIWQIGSEMYISYFSTSYTLENDTIDPNGDVLTEWDTEGAPATHTEAVLTIDDGKLIKDYLQAHTDTFDFETIALGGYDLGEIYQIKAHFYCKWYIFADRCDVNANGDGMGQRSFFPPLVDPPVYGWVSVTWSGLSLVQADLDALTISLTPRPNRGIMIEKLYLTIYFYGDVAVELVAHKLSDDSTHTNNMGSDIGRSWNVSQKVTIGTKSYFLWYFSDENVEIWLYDQNAGTFSELEDCGTNSELPPIYQRAIAYDNNDILSFVLGLGTKEVSTIVADIQANIDDEDYIIYYAIEKDYEGISSEKLYHIWFDKAGDGVWTADPGGGINIKCDISGDVTAQNVSDTIEAAIDAITIISCDNAGGVTCTLTCHHNGNTTNIVDVDSGLVVLTTVPGVANTYYYYTYSISKDALTQGGIYNISLMLNRNTNSSDEPEFFSLEKAFHLTDRKVYQISRARGNLKFISSLEVARTVGTIISITDSILIVDNGVEIEVWEFLDYSNFIFFDIRHKLRLHSQCELDWLKQTDYGDPPVKDQFVQLFDRYSSANLAGDVHYGPVSPDDFHDDNRDLEWYFGSPDDWNVVTAPKSITVAGDMAFIDTLTLPNDCTCELLAEFDNHKNVLKLSHDGGAADPSIVHAFPNGAEASGIREFWIGTSDISRVQYFSLYEGGGHKIAILYIASKIYHQPNNVNTDTGVVPVNNILNHIKITFDCGAGVNGEYQLYIDEAQIGGDHEMKASADNLDNFRMVCSVNAIYSQYLDAFGDPANSEYTEGDNLTPRYIYGEIINWVDNATLPNTCTCTLETIGNHKKVLAITHDGGADDPIIIHDFPEGDEASGIREWWWGTSDIIRHQQIRFKDSTTIRFRFQILASSIYYYDGDLAAFVDSGEDFVNNVLRHFRVSWDCATDLYSLWIDEVLIVSDIDFENAGDNVDNFYVINVTNTAYSQYIDGYNDPANVNTYQGKNLVKYDDDLIIFEGLVRDYDLNKTRGVYLESSAKEDLNFTPEITDYTNYTGKTSGQIITQLLSDFCNYIIAGSISNGSTTWICPANWECNGDKKLKRIINDFCDTEEFVWRLRPTGELDVDDGSLKSYIHYRSSDEYDDPYVRILSQEINQVILMGGFGSDSIQIGPVFANILASQQTFGIRKWTKTYSAVLDKTILQTIADNKLLLETAAPLLFFSMRNMAKRSLTDITINTDFGLTQIGETWYVEDGVVAGDDADVLVPEEVYILDENIYNRDQESELTLTEGILFKDSEDDLAQQNSQEIQQLAGIIHNIGGGLILYLHQDASADIGGYLKMCVDASDDGKTEVTGDIAVTGDDQEIEQWVTPVGCPAISELIQGIYTLHFHAYKFSGTKDLRIYFKVYHRTHPGGVETLIGTSEESDILGDAEDGFEIHALLDIVALDPTDRIVLKVFAHLEGVGSNPVLRFYVEGDTLTRLQVPITLTDKTYQTEQHTRKVPADQVLPDEVATAGNNNCYWVGGVIAFGITAYQNSTCRCTFTLDDDYVAGTDIVFKFSWSHFGGAGARILDYEIKSYRTVDNTATNLEDTDSGQFDGTDAKPQFEEITIDGTNFTAGDTLGVYVSIDDNAGAQLTFFVCKGIYITVDGRD